MSNKLKLEEEINIIQNLKLISFLKEIFNIEPNDTLDTIDKTSIKSIVKDNLDTLNNIDDKYSGDVNFWKEIIKEWRKEIKHVKTSKNKSEKIPVEKSSKSAKPRKFESETIDVNPLIDYNLTKPKKSEDIEEDVEDIEEDVEDIEEDIEEDVEEIKIVSGKDLDDKTVSQHRKAYVKWINEDFYKRLQHNSKYSSSSLKIYQQLVKSYLNTSTPYRGLLVYHGLGTGKTATAISTAESLSSQLNITTLLPASLEANFITEVIGEPSKDKKGWGWNELQIDQSWKFYTLDDLEKDEHVSKFKEKYNCETTSKSTKLYTKIKNKALQNIKKDINSEDEPDKFKLFTSEIKKHDRGIYLSDVNGTSYDSLSDTEKILLESQIEILVSIKYNFIHYRPLPTISKSKNRLLKEFEDESDSDDDLLLDEDDEKIITTNNQKIIIDLEKKLKYNVSNYNIFSPFYKQVIIIDEVHNFVRQVLNNSIRTKVFYDWIINAEQVKLVFLSGTPIINRPCEIAILFNMLKGLIKIYTFEISTKLDYEEVNEKCNNIFYEQSNIDLHHVVLENGKILISVIPLLSNFESLLDENDNIVYTIQNNHNILDFFDTIYECLHKIFDKDSIKPSHKLFNELPDREKNSIIRGSKKYNTELKDISKLKTNLSKKTDVDNIIFNKTQKLFDISIDGKLHDMTSHDNFMNFFFEKESTVHPKKRVLLKRMLMGLTSYYPIDRTSIVDMPTIIKPEYIPDIYQDYTIVNDLNVVPCLMSELQFEKYVEAFTKEKSLDSFRRMKNSYNDDDPYHYQIRTRQSCNIIFRNDDFRIKKLPNDKLNQMKEKVYDELLQGNDLNKSKELNVLSPKMYKILENVEKFVHDKKSTGKILFYSDFRSDAGSEAFELVLKSNGYEPFDTNNPQTTKHLRYTFITGKESAQTRKINLENYKQEDNKFGEYIQIMLISSAGAEGLSLNNVRQVHILEPYWNYVRIGQVLGRAIRMKSHITLDRKDQNVEQYIYCSFLPLGTTIESAYETIKNSDTWNIPNIPIDELRDFLAKEDNKTYRDIIDTIIRVNVDTSSKSADQYLFDTMENKNKISQEITNIIKESSLDCIQHTRDDPQLNDKCIRFSDKLNSEIAYFPGMDAHILDITDNIQIKAKFLYHLKPDIYVISAADTSQHTIYIYYKIENKPDDDELDVRYIREYGKRLCDVYIDMKLAFTYVDKDHEHNDYFDKQFSVFQDIFYIHDDIYTEYIQLDTFPSLKILNKTIIGYKLKYNINDSFYFLPETSMENYNLVKMYPFTDFMNQQIKLEQPIIFAENKLYIKTY